MHLFSGDTAPTEHKATEQITEAQVPSINAKEGDRVAQLEEEVVELRRELNTLREQFAAFQKQFQ